MTRAAPARSPVRPRAHRLADPLPALVVAADAIAATVEQGVHGRRRVGVGEAFWQYRRYQPGDSAARIDWRRSARGDHLYVREHEWEAAQTVWLWVDRSPSMAWAGARRRPTKGDRARLIAMALVLLLARAGERVALLDRGQAPLTGLAAIDRIARLLEADAATEAAGKPAATPSLPRGEALPRHARMVVISDFLAPVSELTAVLAGFTARAIRGPLVQVLDPAEETLPYSGRIAVEGTEGEPGLLVPRIDGIRDAYARRLAAHRDALARVPGWPLITHRSDRPATLALLALVDRLGRGTGAP